MFFFIDILPLIFLTVRRIMYDKRDCAVPPPLRIISVQAHMMTDSKGYTFLLMP